MGNLRSCIRTGNPVEWLAFIGLGIYELLPGFIAGLVSAVVVTLIDREPGKDVQDLFDLATSGSNE